MRWVLLVLALPVVACGGSQGPSAPSSSTSSPATQTLVGRAVATADGAPLAGVTVSAGPASTTTDSAGGFSIAAPAFPLGLTLQGPSITTRALTVTTPGNVVVDAFRLDGQFDLTFYRQLVRDGFDAGAFDISRRQPSNPPIYVRTVDEAGAAIPVAQLDAAEAALRSVVPLWTGGVYSVTQLQRGSAPAPVNWLQVVWSDAQTGKCDLTPPGGLRIELDYRVAGCGCGGLAINARTIKHAAGHAFGFRHTDSQSDLMWHVAATCDLDPSPRERYHAALAYKRPFGNRDVDVDP